jgi:hypothetical protein
MRTGGEPPPAFGTDVALDALRRSGAVMYVLSEGPAAGISVGGPSAAVVLNDGARESGGRLVEVVGTTILPQLLQIAAELINRYEITYTLPPGVASSDSISVSSTRKSVTVRAPSRVPR